MALSERPSYHIVRTSTTLPAGGADTLVDVSPIEDIAAVWVVSGPADAAVKFGGTGAAAIPVSSSDPFRGSLTLAALYGSSTTGGTLVLEVHGR